MSDTQLTTLVFKSGIDKNSTDYRNKGKWIDCDKVRFRYGKAEKLGGWVKEQTNGVQQGVARDITSWLDLSLKKYLGIGTHLKLYLVEENTYYDITPVRETTSEVGNVSSTAGSTTLVITLNAHNCIEGDSILIDQSTGSVGGNIVLDGEYLVSEIIDNDTIEIEVETPAVSTSTNDTISHRFRLLLQGGSSSNGPRYGWGAGRWNEEAWGTPRSQGVTIPLRQWTLTDWGEDLLACPSGGGIYTWDATTGVGTRATLISEAPAEVHTILVSQPTRHLVALGCTDFTDNFDPLLVRWASSEDFSDWTPTALNTAGSQRLSGGNRIVGAIQSRRETLILTDESVHTMRYIGGQFVFSFDELGKNAGLVSTHGAIDVNGVAYWFGKSSFHIYDGTLRTLPCSLQKALFDEDQETSYNKDQADKIYAGVNSEFHEVWWLYPSRDSEECDRYVCYNYLENVWYDGNIDRTVFLDADLFDRPYAISPAGELFIHEEGKNDDSLPMYSWIQSGEFEIEDGENYMLLDKFVPDFKLVGQIQVSFNYRKYPQGGYFTKGPFNVLQTTPKVSLRVRGRDLQIKYETNEVNGDFEVGSPRISIQPDGER